MQDDVGARGVVERRELGGQGQGPGADRPGPLERQESLVAQAGLEHSAVGGAEDNYTADRDQVKALQQAAEQKTGVPEDQYRRFGLNPLSGKPVVASVTDEALIPVPAYLLRKASPLGIYHAGIDRWGGIRADERDEKPAIGDLQALAVVAVRRDGQLDHLNGPAIRRTVPITPTA